MSVDLPIASDALALWMGREILPHEAGMRRWLRRLAPPGLDEDDIIQEAYCRIVLAANPAMVRNGQAYFRTIVRNIVLEEVRRSKTVSFSLLADLDLPEPRAAEPSPEAAAGSRQEWRRMVGLLSLLPSRCREIFTLRKIDGLPQREIARRLGVSENVVENQALRGLRLLLRAMAETDSTVPEPEPDDHYLRHDQKQRRQR